jgi:hypothetical protein
LPGAVCQDGEGQVGRDGGSVRLLVAAGVADIEHLGSAHDEAELEALKAAARQRGGWSSTWALSLRAAGRASHLLAEGHLLDALKRAYLVLRHAISGRQLAHDLFRRVLLPRSQVDVRAFPPNAGRKTLKKSGSRCTWTYS